MICNALKPCPFCGAAGEIHDWSGGGSKSARCSNAECIAHFAGHGEPTGFVPLSAWNTRAHPDTAMKMTVDIEVGTQAILPIFVRTPFPNTLEVAKACAEAWGLLPGQAKNGWQLIETAPKDGSQVDLWIQGKHGGYRVTSAKWDGREWVHYSLDTSGGYGELDWVPIHEADGITHWMRAPQPPLDEKQKESDHG